MIKAFFTLSICICLHIGTADAGIEHFFRLKNTNDTQVLLYRNNPNRPILDHRERINQILITRSQQSIRQPLAVTISQTEYSDLCDGLYEQVATTANSDTHIAQAATIFDALAIILHNKLNAIIADSSFIDALKRELINNQSFTVIPNSGIFHPHDADFSTRYFNYLLEAPTGPVITEAAAAGENGAGADNTLVRADLAPSA